MIAVKISLLLMVTLSCHWIVMSSPSQVEKKKADAEAINQSVTKEMQESSLATTVNDLKLKVDELKTQNDALNQEFITAKKDAYERCDNLKAENKALKLELNSSKSAYMDLFVEMNQWKIDSKMAVENLKEEVKELRAKVNENVTQMMSSQGSFVAFTAYPTQTRQYNDGDRLLFDGVVSNYGGYYNATVGIFTCPINGYYLFFVTVYENDLIMWANMRLDGTNLVSIYSRGEYDMGSNTVFSYCSEGQEVDVACNGDGRQLHGDDNISRFSSFSGTLLRLQS